MIQFTCERCGNEEWTVHGSIDVTGNRPSIEEIRCTDCENTEPVL